jgi:hypothetical protein
MKMKIWRLDAATQRPDGYVMIQYLAPRYIDEHKACQQHPSEQCFFGYNLWAMQTDQSKTTVRWIAYRRWIQISLLAAVAAW